MRLWRALGLAVLAACSSGNPVVAPSPTRAPASASPTASSAASSTPSVSPHPSSPRPSGSPSGAPVYAFEGGQMSLEMKGDPPYAGSRILDQGFSAPPSGGEADGTYGWTNAAGDRVVLNVPARGPWTVGGFLDGSQMSFQQCTVRTERNDPGGLIGSFTCARVTRAGAVAPSWTATASFALEP